MSDYPELPGPVANGSWTSCVKCQEYPAAIFSAEQMRAYVDADRAMRANDANDAARYRWLRAQENNTDAPRIDVVHWEAMDESANQGTGLRTEELDAAIDAAMKA